MWAKKKLSCSWKIYLWEGNTCGGSEEGPQTRFPSLKQDRAVVNRALRWVGAEIPCPELWLPMFGMGFVRAGPGSSALCLPAWPGYQSHRFRFLPCEMRTIEHSRHSWHSVPVTWCCCYTFLPVMSACVRTAGVWEVSVSERTHPRVFSPPASSTREH